MRLLAIGICALALIPGAARAQSVEKSAKGPTLQAAAIGFHDARVNASAKSMSMQARPHAGQDVALMVVGAGAMIVGAIVGDTPGTIILIGGAAMALYGLYHYLE